MLQRQGKDVVFEKNSHMIFLSSYIFNKHFPIMVHSIMSIQLLGGLFQAQLFVLHMQGFWLSQSIC